MKKNAKTQPLSAEASEICERLRGLRKLVNLPQKDFAAAIGISQGHLSVIEKRNHAPSETLLLATCHRFKASEEWLLEGKGTPFTPAVQTHGIPVFNQLPESYPEVAGGTDILGYLSLPDLPENCFALYQRGDYMAPTIQANDLMVFEPVESIESEDIVLLKNKWGTWIVRRFRRAKNRSTFTADNTAYKAFTYDIGKQSLLARIRVVLRSVNY
jgi:transcriptional regulator with XRE-family HTH domain